MLRWLSYIGYGLVCLVVLLGIVSSMTAVPTEPHDLLDKVQELNNRGQKAESAQLLLKWAEQPGAKPRTLVAAGRLLLEQKDAPAARQFLERIPSDDAEAGSDALIAQAQSYLDEGRVGECARMLQKNYDQFPINRINVRMRLASTLDLAGRRREAWTIRREAAYLYDTSVELMRAMANPEDPPAAVSLRAGAEEDPWRRLGNALAAIERSDWATAEADLSYAESRLPDELDVYATRMRLIARQQDFKTLPAWNARAPQGADDLADVWLARAGWAESQQDQAATLRCLVEAVLRDPRRRSVLRRIVELAHARDGAAPTADLATIADQLEQVAAYAEELVDSVGDMPLIQKAAELLEEMKLKDEAVCWAKLAAESGPRDDVEWAVNMVTRLQGQEAMRELGVGGDSAVPPDPLRARVESALTAAQLSPDQLPLPKWPAATSTE